MGDLIMYWVWQLCNRGFEGGFSSEVWINVVTIPLNKNKRERTEMTKGLIGYEQGMWFQI